MNVNNLFNQMHSFHIRLREERKRLAFSQEQMAAAGGVQRNTQSLYERGERKPDIEYLAGIAKAGADILFIITGERMPLKSSTLSIKESSLIDSYRAAAEEGRKALEATGTAVAQQHMKGKL